MIETGDLSTQTRPSGFSSWEQVLSALEREVATSERLVELVRGGLAPDEVLPSRSWSAPDGLGQLTEDLLARAQKLLGRQEAVTVALAAALVDVRARQRRSIRTLAGDYPSADGTASAYVDVQA